MRSDPQVAQDSPVDTKGVKKALQYNGNHDSLLTESLQTKLSSADDNLLALNKCIIRDRDLPTTNPYVPFEAQVMMIASFTTKYVFTSAISSM
jgi:hypothetical protein